MTSKPRFVTIPLRIRRTERVVTVDRKDGMLPLVICVS